MPVNISYKIEPKLHQSTACPCPLPSIISGAKYSGVPQNDLALLLSEIFSLLKPKSVILIYPSLFISTFSGFKLNYNLYNYKLTLYI